MPELAILLRNGSHADATVRYALKCNDIAISISKTPIQIPIPQQSPELIDIGYFRPSITLAGLVDTVGGNIQNNATGNADMSYFDFVRQTVSATAGSAKWADGGTGDTTAKRYYIPYKNALEEACVKWIYTNATELELEVGDSKFPVSAAGGGYLHGSVTQTRYASNTTAAATGGAIYRVAIQQARFQLNAAREDRYDFTMQFVAEARLDVS